MIKNYLKLAFRILLRNKSYSLITIAGLSVGLALTFMITLYSVHELSYDKYNKKLDRIYVLTMDFFIGVSQPRCPFPAGPALKEEFPEVKEYARFEPVRCEIGFRDKTFDKVRCVCADSTIFDVLTLPIISGSLADLSAERNSAVISLGLAKRLFGSDNPIGKVITVHYWGQPYDFEIAAVMANIPSTSTFRADCIMPLFPFEQSVVKRYRPGPEPVLETWRIGIIPTYLLLSNRSSADQLAAKLAGLSKEHTMVNGGIPSRLHIRPLKDIYFHSSDLVNSPFPEGNITDVHVYSAIGLLTLLIACINFIILSTGRGTVRTKEVGVRKVVGASRFDLSKQVMIETVTLSLLSLPVALLLSETFMPSFTRFIGENAAPAYYHTVPSILLCVAVTLTAGILSGSYISFHLSGFRPIDILKNKFAAGQTKVAFRRVLIGVQMMIFVGLISTSITVYRQMRYVHTKDMGFDTRNLVVFSDFSGGLSDHGFGDRFESFKDAILSLPDVSGVAGGTYMPGTLGYTVSAVPEKSDPRRFVKYQMFTVSRDFFETLGMKMVRGKTFAEATSEEGKNAIIINQTAMRDLGIKNTSAELFQGQRILGVVKDFNMHSLHEQVVPTVFEGGTGSMYEIAIRLRHSKGVSQTLATVEHDLEKFDGGKRADFQSFTDRINDLYGSDYKFADMIGSFTALAIFVASLGLFGMSQFVIQRRVKEIGIRKVLGASVPGIFLLVVKEFVVSLLISSAISLPVAVYLSREWLRDYAYHVNAATPVSVGITILSGLVVVVLAVGYVAVKAATANPVNSLRYE